MRIENCSIKIAVKKSNFTQKRNKHVCVWNKKKIYVSNRSNLVFDILSCGFYLRFIYDFFGKTMK